MRKLTLVVVLFALSVRADLHEYEGRYEQSDGNAVIVQIRRGVLTARPVFWRSIQTLAADGPDRFHVAERPERKAVFSRDAAGRIAALTVNGIGHDGPMPRITHERPLPSELIMSGHAGTAAQAVLARPDAADIAVRWGEFIGRALPTKFAAGAEFVGAVAAKHPADARLQVVQGALLVGAGRRDEAERAYRRALELDPENEQAAIALRMLGTAGDLGPLFARPRRNEIREVLRRWNERDLEPRDVRIVHRGSISLGHGPAEVRIVAHTVLGSTHYGAVIVPAGATRNCCPVIVEAKGVSPSYFPLDLSRVPYGPEVMAEDQSKFVYFLPAYRGEVLLVDGQTFASAGDRTNVWDGATDDFIAFTAAALTVTPEADASRVAAFGKSRGGTVALLAGIRDRRFDCVVAWSAPADHFFEMVQSGWTPRERAEEGLRQKAGITGIGGQFIETFLAPKRPTAETRLHLLASSPLWFANRLPPAQAHYGEDDNMVQARNGRALFARNRRIEAVFHHEAGHDLDPDRAARETRRFLLQRLVPR